MSFGFEESPEERLFKAALSLPEEEREAFMRQGAGDDEDLYENAKMLLLGYEQVGGDEIEVTQGGGKARQRWATSHEAPGTVIGNFTLVRKIGEGGMGTVWEAEQKEPIARRVALKLIKLGMDTAEVVKRFERERQTLALLAHPNIAAVYEAGATALGRPFFVMELVDGEPITDLGTKHDFSIDDRLQLVLQVCLGIEHAHRKGVIHRDLKTSNILVNKEGVPKIIDFGIAKAAADEGGTLFTRETQMLGTPAYMSPEQAAGDASAIDTRSDVYSLVSVLYELLSGAPPFDPDRLASTGLVEMQKILTEEDPPKPSTRRTGMRHAELGATPPADPPTLHFEKDLDWIVMKAMAKEPERRYQTAAAFSADIRRYLDGAVVEAVPPSTTYRLGKFVRRHPSVVALAALLLLASCSLAVWKSRAHQKTLAQSRELAEKRVARAEVADKSGNPLVAALWHAAAADAVRDLPDDRHTHLRNAAQRTAGIALPVKAFRLDHYDISRLNLDPSGRFVIVEDRQGEECLLDLRRGTRVSLDGENRFDALAFNRDGTRLAAVRPGGKDVELWTVGAKPTRLGRVTVGDRGRPNLACLAFSHDGTRLAVGARKTVSILVLDDQEQMRTSMTMGYVNDVIRLVFSPTEADVLAITGEKQEVSLVRLDLSTASSVDLYPPTRTRTPLQPTDVIDTPIFTSDGKFVCRRNRGGWVTFQLEPFLFLQVPAGKCAHLFSVSPDARRRLIRNTPETQTLRMELMDPTEKDSEKSLFDGVVTAAAFSSDSAKVIAGDSRGVVRVMEVSDWSDNGRLFSVLADTHATITAVAFLPDGRSVLTANYLGIDDDWSLLRLWRLPGHGRSLTEADMNLDIAALNAANTIAGTATLVPLGAAEWWSIWQDVITNHPGFSGANQ